ncbi:MAG: transglycosylase domain-containing protein, partial [Pseudomonadota bacterium]
MLFLIRILTRALETTLAMPVRIAAAFIVNVAYNPRLGWLRYVAFAGIAYVGFAVTLVYVIAPIRGMVGVHYDAAKLNYAAERWAGTAIYDKRGDFVGTYGLRDDSVRDVNYTSKPIAYANYEASPDHKIIPALDVPDDYWRCLKHHEDRYLGTWRNPSGIDLVGVLKIPFTTIARTLRTGRPSLGVGGSTLPMQFARVIYKTPPRRGESPWEKLGRKMREWWIAPVVYHHLTRGGDITPLKQWAANHLWLAQRTGGASLQGIEVASQIIFGKDARDLTTAEQFVLASAVNKPIILLKGSDKLNRVRIDRWRYILEVRATHCATALIRDPDRQAQVFHDLIQMGSGPPDPKVRPRLEAALETYHPRLAKRAEANPELRARTLVPSARLGAKAEMKQAFGNQWRNHVRTV